MATISKKKFIKFLLFQPMLLSLLFVTLGSCVRYYSQEAKVDLNKYKQIFIGWVDLHEDNWGYHFYETKEEWTKSINKLNSGFQARLKNEFLTDKTIIAAENNTQEPTEKNGLYIKFSNVRIDQNQYNLYMDLAFIDLETSSKLYEIHHCRFYGNAYGFENMLYYALEEAEKLIYREIYQKDNFKSPGKKLILGK